MHRNDSPVPLKKPSNTYFVDHNHVNYNTDQAYKDHQHASLSGGDWGIAFYDGPLPASQDFIVCDLLCNPEIPSLNAYNHWPMVYQSPLLPRGLDGYGIPGAFGNSASCVFDGSVERFSNRLENTAPTYDSFLFPSANVQTAHVVDNPEYQHPLRPPPGAASAASRTLPQTSARIVSPPIVVASLEEVNPPLYQCLECPNMPKFSSQKDLVRHSSSKAHWSKKTRHYRCCCAKYERPRKDNHLRHVQSCSASARIPYACICGSECRAQDQHVAHVVVCGRARRRRRLTAP